MKKHLLIILAISGAVLLTSSQDEKLFRLNRTFEIYGAVVREINELYIEEVDPDELLVDGINGMFEDLDPYTEFYQEREKDKINMITEGNYVGFGINISRKKGEVIVSGFANDFQAQESGLRIGDKLYKVDGTEVLNLDTDELKQYSQGVPGSIAQVEVIRAKDTVSLELERHKVQIDNVIYFGRTQKGMGFIKLERFSRGASEEVEDALSSLKNRNINGLILDLRDNPGGLLDEAVRICELFIPKDSEIVSTRAKNNRKTYEYLSRRTPKYPDLPIAVLIDEGSASASEIVAGCLQDHDRAVIIGRNSFGKGLVQTIRQLPYKTSMKLTTARYYTPSGRSIQRKDYYDKVTSDTTIFYTDGGRPMTERRGISPDTIISKKIFSDFITDIYNDDMIFDFGTKKSFEFEAKEFQPPRYFEIDDSLIVEFSEFLKNKSYIYRTEAEEKIEELYIDAVNLKLDNQTDSLLDELSEKFEVKTNVLVELEKEEIRKLLKYEIMKRFYNRTDLTAIFIQSDSTVITAENILASDSYTSILQINSKENH